MPECPHCHEYFFGNPDQCPKCSYDFILHKVLTKDNKIQVQQERNQLRLQEEERRQQARLQEEERRQQAMQNRTRALENNPLYEYTTVYLADSQSGILDKSCLDTTLQHHAEQGWRLHSVVTNEVGKNLASYSFGGTTSGVNSTMEVTILIFERCIKLPGQ